MSESETTRLRRVDGPVVIRHGLYLSTGQTEDGRFLAVCSDGTPQLGHHPVTVLTLEIVRDQADAEAWFARVRRERPWEARH